jgi:predicted lipoprotein with Yx(FWY)xxD motif
VRERVDFEEVGSALSRGPGAPSVGALCVSVQRKNRARARVLGRAMPKITYLTLPAILTALIVAGCGSSGSSSSSSSASPSNSNSSSAVKIEAQSSSLGKILTDGSGRTLYLFEKDTGPKSNCSGVCAANWPPFTAASKPAVAGGASSADITLIKRSGGKQQVAYKGHPLYHYAGDSSAGDLNGQGMEAFGAEWYVLSPTGSKVEGKEGSDDSSSSSSNSGSTGRYGY